MLTGFELARLNILGLGTIFCLAILDSGEPDAVEHLPFSVTMATMFVHGHTRLQRRLRGTRRGLLSEGRRTSPAFTLAFCSLVAAYYCLQCAEYGGYGPAMLAAVARADRGNRRRPSSSPCAKNLTIGRVLADRPTISVRAKLRPVPTDLRSTRSRTPLKYPTLRPSARSWHPKARCRMPRFPP